MPIKRKPTVMIADDETHIRLLIKTMLAGMNAEVVAEASNGEEVFDLFKEKKPDIVLLDVNMPILDGTEALKRIMACFPDAFVVMLSSVSDRETVEACIDLGAAHYIRKDTPIPEMRKIIQTAWVDFKTRELNQDA
jgi:two-component system chemotaxis response regulator CheY